MAARYPQYSLSERKMKDGRCGNPKPEGRSPKRRPKSEILSRASTKFKEPRNTRKGKSFPAGIPRISCIPRLKKLKPFCGRVKKDEAKSQAEFLTWNGLRFFRISRSEVHPRTETKNPTIAVCNSSFELIRNRGTRRAAFDFQSRPVGHSPS